MKQALALSLAGFQGLGHDDSRERPVDRVGAAGAIQIARATEEMQNAFLCALGVDLIAFKFGNRAASKADAEDHLAIALAWPRLHLHLRARQRTRIACWAVQEWAIDMCPVCRGAKEIPDRGAELEGRQPMKPCPPTTGCGGTGKRRYSDAERADALGGNFDKAMAEAHGLIGRAEDLAVRTAREMLGRWIP